MTPRRWRELEDLYHAARDLKPAARAALLEGTDPELRKEVESLLAHPGSLPDISVPGHILPEASLQLEPGSRLGPYRIEGRLGVGGMGEVYRAHDTQLDRAAAIKILPAALARDPERLARFEREAKALASLNHPNIAQVYGIVQGADTDSSKARGIAMELVPGANIAGPLPVETVIEYAQQIASALEAAHERGIVHRDLKPANIMATPEGVVKLLDFGLARLSVEDAGGPHESPAVMASPTRAGIILGTAAYMAPEQARGKVVDKRADIWAFGVVLYEISTGKRLFSGETVTDILASIVKDEPDLTRAPQKLRRLLAACLEKDPKRRLRDIADWERLIEQERAPVTHPRVRRPVWMAALGMTALALIALAAVHFREERPSASAMHLTVPLPNTVTGVSGLALSPDGRTLLLKVTDKDPAKTGLALRSLSSDQIRLLPGTGRAAGAFWSPDGKRIAFSESDGKLRIMSAGGGPAEVVFEGPGCGCGGGTWGAGGVILIVDFKQQFERCDAERSACRPLTDDATIKREGPVFLPDGNHFLFTVRAAVPEAAAREGLYVGSLEDPRGKRLLPDTTKGAFAEGPDGQGYLLFRRDEALVGQAFDRRALALSGDVFRIAPEVSRDGSNQMMASAAANGVLVYETGREHNTQLTWVDRAGKVLSVAGPVRNQHSVALSPQGDRILVTRGPQGGVNQGLWLREAMRDSESRIAAPPLSGEAGVWSPDGRTVAFSGTDRNLYRKDVSSGAKEELILKDGNEKFLSDWSRDGRYLVFTETDPKTKGDIWVLPDPLGNPGGIAGAGKPYPFQRTDAIESQARISPDGKWIAYTSDESGSEEVYVRPFPSGPGRWKVSAGFGFEPRWRSDGKELFYWTRGLAPRSRMMAVAIETSTNESFAPSEPRSLFEQGLFKWTTWLNFSTYSPSADGQRFLVLSKPDEQETIHVLYNWTQIIREKQ